MVWFAEDDLSITVEIIDGPLPPLVDVPVQGAGATIIFNGIVRPLEGTDAIAALDYEVYSPMAQNVLESLATEMLKIHDLLAIHVWHSRGRVGVGQVSFRLHIAATHRKEAIAAMDQFIDRLKQDVPIWKHPVPLDRQGGRP